MRRFLMVGAAALLFLAAAAPGLAKGRGNPNPGVLPPQSHAFGQSYGEWGADWWNWAFSSPIEVNPLTDTTGEFCDTNQPDGPVFFLAGFLDLTGTGGPVMRDCTVPSGKALFFPIVNSVFAGEFPTEEETRAAANAAIDAVIELEAGIDGEPLRDLWRYRAESPNFVLELPEGAILDQLLGLSGDQSPSVTDGYWLMLAPLPPGEHTIHFRGLVMNPDGSEFEVEVFYFLTVVPRGQLGK
ncbi:MAG: hypothetical protein ACREJB_08750 [Planctomycetaceae bacterium]